MLPKPRGQGASGDAFQSSSAPKSGCCLRVPVALVFWNLSILIRSEERMLLERAWPDAARLLFQSSSAPKSGCCNSPRELFHSLLALSILIRSEERMLLLTGGGSANAPLSILIRSEERMLPHTYPPLWRVAQSFNPHPLRRADAAGATATLHVEDLLSILIRSEERMLLVDGQEIAVATWLSILIRSEERMLLCPPGYAVVSRHLSILIRSEERMLQDPRARPKPERLLSILIRSEERMLPSPVPTCRGAG